MAMTFCATVKEWIAGWGRKMWYPVAATIHLMD